MVSFPCKTILVLSLTIVFTHFGSSFAATIGKKASSVVNIKDICSNAPNPPSCMQILKSIPTKPNTNLTGIANLAIDLAEKTTKKTIIFTKILIQSVGDAKLKSRYASCNHYFNAVVVALGKGRKSLHSGDWNGLNEAAVDAVELAESCEDEFEDMPDEPSLRPHKIKEVVDHSGVVFAIAQKGSS